MVLPVIIVTYGRRHDLLSVPSHPNGAFLCLTPCFRPGLVNRLTVMFLSVRYLTILRFISLEPLLPVIVFFFL